ncbi:suppressor of fused domain protein [Hahella sp. CR1]|uniref:hypothetical protein n=1 Tax=Hahella sp. CR1 TaxID=2992807 RepID=UPI002442A7CC|nr:hypothetical protein [Hahella sp. CR1]MDG9667627.1 suppressor of fused domain protein [Hahella sp. CR1]
MTAHYKTAEALIHLVKRSPFMSFVSSEDVTIGFRFDNKDAYVLGFGDEDEPEIKHYLDYRDTDAVDYWAYLQLDDLFSSLESGTGLSELKLIRSEGVNDIHPKVDSLVMKCLAELGPYPLSDREDFVYGSLFGYDDPQVIWQSEHSPLRVLRYCDEENELDILVTSGFSDQNSENCFELLMITDPDSAPLIRQFVGWAINFEHQFDTLEVGDFLQTNEERIPDTIYGGFLVLPPVSINEEFPVGNHMSKWRVLLGATPSELAIAKTEGPLHIAQKIFEAGYYDTTPDCREPVA